MRWCEPIRILAALALILLGACQPLPRPLADIARPGPDLLNLPGRGGVVVLEVDGLSPERAQAFAEAMTAALTEAEVPASVGGGTRESLFLMGRAETRQAGNRLIEVTFIWDLFDSNSKPLGTQTHRQVVSQRDWEDARPGDLARLARAAAPSIAEIYFGGMPREAGERPRPGVVVADVTGAPGDGAKSLSRAMATTLASARVQVVSDRAQAVAVVAGAVTVGPGKGRNAEAVEIKWQVVLPSGQEVGVVSQSNEIPAGSLKGAWGETAALIAIAAAPGIVELIARIPPDAAPAAPAATRSPAAAGQRPPGSQPTLAPSAGFPGTSPAGGSAPPPATSPALPARPPRR